MTLWMAVRLSYFVSGADLLSCPIMQAQQRMVDTRLCQLIGFHRNSAVFRHHLSESHSLHVLPCVFGFTSPRF